MANTKRLWFIAPFWLCLAVDVTLTLAGQSEEYWNGDYTAATEANPFAHPILVIGPWIFALLAIGWSALLAGLAVWIPHRALAWIVVVLTVAHAIGGSTWLARIGMWGWILAIVYLALASEAAWWCWRKSEWLRAEDQNQQAT